MQTLQEFIVNEHIDDLRREAEMLRTERRMRHRTRDDHGSVTASSTHTGRGSARVRVGHWLIGIGLAVSGSAGDARATR